MFCTFLSGSIFLDLLHLVKEFNGDQWFMNTVIGLGMTFQLDDTHIEGIAENEFDLAFIDFASPYAA